MMVAIDSQGSIICFIFVGFLVIRDLFNSTEIFSEFEDLTNFCDLSLNMAKLKKLSHLLRLGSR